MIIESMSAVGIYYPLMGHENVSKQIVTTSDWINGLSMPIGDSDAVRLFCFPHAGGGASVFRRWTTELGRGIEVYTIILPGREGRWREPPITRMPELLEALIDALGPLLHPPYAFFGHSLGAFIAFELARQLHRENRPGPALLIVSAARAPQIPDPDPPLHKQPADLLLEELKRLDGIPQELLNQPELISLMMPALRADLAISETYQYVDEPPLACPISVYGAEHDGRVRVEHLEQWKEQTSRSFQCRIFPGNHFFFLREAQFAVMEAVREDLHHYHAMAGTPETAPLPLQQKIASVWADLLHVPNVGIDDNFFDLGGNSLLMVQAYGKLCETSMMTLSVLDLFRYPTARMLANAMGGKSTGFAKVAGAAVGERRIG